MLEYLDQRPVIVAIAGPNGAGKSTFYEAFIRQAALRFVNADVISLELGLEPYSSAAVAARLRHELVDRRESFVFETVFSDPAGDKIAFLRDAANRGYTVLLCFIGLNSAETSDARVALRVSQGGHDVPQEKVIACYPRTLRNLSRAIQELPMIEVFDNSDLAAPFRLIAEYRDGKLQRRSEILPEWFLGATADDGGRKGIGPE